MLCVVKKYLDVTLYDQINKLNCIVYSFFGEEDTKDTAPRDDDGDNGQSFSHHWGWWGTIYQLSKSGILQITGDKSITDVNFLTAMNYLEIDKDYNAEVQRMEKPRWHVSMLKHQHHSS